MRAVLTILCILAALRFSFGSPILYDSCADGQQLNCFAAAERISRETVHVHLTALIYGDESRQAAWERTLLAIAYEDQGRFSDAEPLLEEAVDKRMNALDRDDRDGLFCGNLAELRAAQCRYSAAEWLYRERLRLHDETFCGSAPHSPIILQRLASICLAEKKYGEAESLCKELLHVTEESCPIWRMQMASAMNILGAIYAKQGQYAESESLYDECLNLCQLESADRKSGPDENFAYVWRPYSLELRNYRPSIASVNDALLTMQCKRFIEIGRKLGKFNR
jgi:tetratricopeptide (TPR) repeat protein